MVKKKKGKSESAAFVTTRLVSMEQLVEVMLSVYMQVGTTPSGSTCGPIEVIDENTERLTLHAMCHYESRCPLNLMAFRNGTNLSKQQAYKWWARSRLRYSCSTICCTFVKCMVPLLKRNNIAELPCTSLAFFPAMFISVFTRSRTVAKFHCPHFCWFRIWNKEILSVEIKVYLLFDKDRTSKEICSSLQCDSC